MKRIPFAVSLALVAGVTYILLAHTGPVVTRLPAPAETTVSAVPVNQCFQASDRRVYRRLALGGPAAGPAATGSPVNPDGSPVSPNLLNGLPLEQLPKDVPGYCWCCELHTGLIFLFPGDDWARPVASEHARVSVHSDPPAPPLPPDAK